MSNETIFFLTFMAGSIIFGLWCIISDKIQQNRQLKRKKRHLRVVK